MIDYSTYQSTYTWRYGSKEMRYIFSEQHKYEMWRRVWVTLAEVQHHAGLVSVNELKDLKRNQNNIDIERITEIEKETRHDVVAAIREFAEKAKIGGGKMHLGATSMDITDNAEMLRMKEAIALVEDKLISVLRTFADKMDKYANITCIGFTHLQPAEPTTVGYRLAFYAQELLMNYEFLQFVKKTIKTKGMKGAVGTSAGYSAVLSETKLSAEQLDNDTMLSLGLEPALITSQVYSRQYDYLVLSFLSTVAASLEKFAVDLRILQSPMFGEWSEPFGKKQVGSSAMPFKKNPISAENLCSLARYVAHLPNVALENAMHSCLERTLDDSANRRSIIPDAFLAVDQILMTGQHLIEGLIINEKRIEFNLNQFAPFAASEGILMEAVKNGADRQEMHELLRETAMKAWRDVSAGSVNPMDKLLIDNKTIKKYVSKEKIKKALAVKRHIGDAPQRARRLVKKINKVIKK